MDLKGEFLKLAADLGFDDVAFVPIDPFYAWEKARNRRATAYITHDPKDLLPSATSIAVLFTYCPPFLPFPKGYAQYPSYFAASHRAYTQAKKLAEFLTGLGFEALHTHKIPQRAAALRHTGFVGCNGLMYHPRFGSYFTLQTILTNAFLPEGEFLEKNECLKCGACARACPAGALGETFRPEKCVRKFLLKKDLAGLDPMHITGLIGCEECQSVCPLNAQHQRVQAKLEEYEPFLLEGLLRADAGLISAAAKVVGRNIARLLPEEAKLLELKNAGKKPQG